MRNYFLIPPRGSFLIQGAQHRMELLLYLALSLDIAVPGGRLQNARLAISRHLQ